MKATTYLPYIIGFFFPLFSFSQLNPIDVTESTLKVGAFSEEVFYYGFAEGDQLIFNFQEEKGKDLKEVEIMELPSSSRFMDYKTKKIQNKIISIQRAGIYKFRFTNNSLGARICKFKIQRIPVSEATRSFNPSVLWKTVYDSVQRREQERYLVKKEYKPVNILGPEKYYINSGTNALFKGGTSRVALPIQLPQNTVEWYYMFTASRDEEEIKKTKSSINLMGQLTRLIDPTGISKIAVNMLTAPPGGNVCDIYLLDPVNRPLFEAKTQYSYFLEGSRENLNSGAIKIKSALSPLSYIGIKNPDGAQGIHVVIEAVAIILEEEWSTREVIKYDITSRQVAYLNN